MYQQRIDLFGCVDTQGQPKNALYKQEERTDDEDKPPLPTIFPAAGNVGAEEQTVNQNQTVIKNAQQSQNIHCPTSPFG